MIGQRWPQNGARLLFLKKKKKNIPFTPLEETKEVSDVSLRHTVGLQIPQLSRDTLRGGGLAGTDTFSFKCSAAWRGGGREGGEGQREAR